MPGPNWNPKPPAQVPKRQISTKSRSFLKPEQFDELIKQQGVPVRIWRSLLCPNVKGIDSGEHEFDCQVCKSSGFLDLSPLDTIAVILDQSLEKAQEAEGYVDHATAKATFLSGVTLQYFTLVEVLNHYDTFIERVKRQPGEIDRLKYSAVQVNALTDGQRQYYAGTDFNLDPNGDLKWILGRGPATGTIYSIHYAMALKFRAVQALHANRFAQSDAGGGNVAFTRMPECWLLQRVYLADRKDYKGNTLAPNLIRNPDDPST